MKLLRVNENLAKYERGFQTSRCISEKYQLLAADHLMHCM